MSSGPARSLELVFDAASLRPSDYLAANPDVRAAGVDALQHYLNHGKAEGRRQFVAGSPRIAPQSPRQVITELASSNGSVLEIGPFCFPAITGHNVRYLDVLNRDGLIERAIALHIDPSRTPDIHFVSPFGDLSIVEEKFDAIFSSHNIEHQPDLVTHLLKAEALLRDGGNYFLLIPDKRYCFDHFLAESTIAGVLDAFYQRRTKHTLSSLIQNSALRTHNDPSRHWNGDHAEDYLLSNMVDRIKSAIHAYESSDGNYIDCHAWQFTPDSFKQIVDTLRDIGLIKYKCEIINTMPESLEFGAILRMP